MCVCVCVCFVRIIICFWYDTAAWGELQNGQWGETFKIFHWELGVFISPQTLGHTNRKKPKLIPFAMNAVKDDDAVVIPIPYKFRPEPHSSNDKPWTVENIT